MPRKNYKPEIGETVFISLSGNKPTLITVTGFHHHSYLDEEVMDFERLNGATNWATYKTQVFFPEIPTDTKYIYAVMLRVDDAYDRTHCYEEAFFFTPEEAFERIEAIERGEIKSKHEVSSGEQEFVVEVEKVS